MKLAGASMLLLVLLSCMLQQSSSEMHSMKEFVSSTIDIDDGFQALNLNDIDSEKVSKMAASLADKFIRVHKKFYLPQDGPRNAKNVNTNRRKLLQDGLYAINPMTVSDKGISGKMPASSDSGEHDPHCVRLQSIYALECLFCRSCMPFEPSHF